MHLFRSYKRLYAFVLLLILLAAQTGHKVHIYLEDHAHFAAFSGDLVPDNGADERVAERCAVDDYGFFPFTEAAQPVHAFYRSAFVVVRPAGTRCKLAAARRGRSLRAPPAC